MLVSRDFVIPIVLAIFTAISGSVSVPESNIQHECLRPCTDGPSSRKVCHYEFFVSKLSTSDSACNGSKVEGRALGCGGRIAAGSFLGINGRSPGPPIEVCLGDTIEVLLYNKLGTEELSLHWHGLRQKGAVHMDGVPMVTQCPILPYGGFRYKIKPEADGTYFYRAHSVSQQGDGVYGSLTVRGPRDDPTLERILLLSSRPPTSLTRHLHLYPPTPAGLLVNGQDDGTVIRVTYGARHLLRVINANAYNCPIFLFASGHTLRVRAADGNLVQPMIATHIVVFPGERLDVTLEADQPLGKYLVNISGLRDCRGTYHEAFLVYGAESANSEAIRFAEALGDGDYAIAEKGYNCGRISESFACALDLKAASEGSAEPSTEDVADEVIYIPFDVKTLPPFADEMTDNSYNIYECVFYPAYLSMKQEGTSIAQINGVSFKYPSSPILSQPENIAEVSICSIDERSAQCANTPLFCECTQILEVPPRRIVDIVLIDQGFGGNGSHTFHVHGYSASVMGRESFERPITKQEIVLLDRDGELRRNFRDPPRKDTFVVPNKGYLILRLYTDNPGYWLWEARNSAISPGLSGPGMQFLMRVGTRESFPPVPLGFPSCGNNKGPDFIFETS